MLRLGEVKTQEMLLRRHSCTIIRGVLAAINEVTKTMGACVARCSGVALDLDPAVLEQARNAAA